MDYKEKNQKVQEPLHHMEEENLNQNVQQQSDLQLQNLQNNNQLVENQNQNMTSQKNVKMIMVNNRRDALSKLDGECHRWFHMDSPLMKNIKKSLRNLNFELQGLIPAGKEERHQAANEIEVKYDIVISYCQKYVDEKKNNERKEVIRQVLEICQREREGFKYALEKAIKEQNDKKITWSSVLGQAGALVEVEGAKLIEEGDEIKIRNKVLHTKMAKLLGVEDLFVETSYVKEGKYVEHTPDIPEGLQKFTYAELEKSRRFSRFVPELAKKLNNFIRYQHILGSTIDKSDIHFIAYLKHPGKIYSYYEIKDFYIDPVKSDFKTKRINKSECLENTHVMNRKMMRSIQCLDKDILNRCFPEMAENVNNLVHNMETLKDSAKQADSETLNDLDWKHPVNRYIYTDQALKEKQFKFIEKCNRDINPSETVTLEGENIQEEEKIVQIPEKINYNGDAKSVKAIIKRLEKQDKNVLENTKAAQRSQYSPKQLEYINSCLQLESYNDKKLFNAVPSREDIAQGHLGDCFLLAGIAAVVDRSPELIMNMMKDYGDFVGVTFPGKKEVLVSKSIVVMKERTTIRNVYAKKTIRNKTGQENWLWVALLEKAYVKAFYINGKNNMLRADGGGLAQYVIQNLTGKSATLQGITIKRAGTILVKKRYKEVWEKGKKIVKGNKNHDQEEMFKFFETHIKQPLIDEVNRRNTIRYKLPIIGINIDSEGSQRNLTVEEIRRTLMDIRNWDETSFPGGVGAIVEEFENQFGAADFDRFLQIMMDIFEESSDQMGTKSAFEHEVGAFSEKDNTYKYTNYAKNIYTAIEAVLKKGPVSIGTREFLHRKGGTGLNGENLTDGIAEGHMYSVVGVRQTKSGQRLFRIRNPWGNGGMKYSKIGNHIYSVKKSEQEIDHGEFEIDLNDLLRFMNVIAFDSSMKGKRLGNGIKIGSVFHWF